MVRKVETHIIVVAVVVESFGGCGAKGLKVLHDVTLRKVCQRRDLFASYFCFYHLLVK